MPKRAHAEKGTCQKVTCRKGHIPKRVHSKKGTFQCCPLCQPAVCVNAESGGYQEYAKVFGKLLGFTEIIFQKQNLDNCPRTEDRNDQIYGFMVSNIAKNAHICAL
jgi:hypothetical protein